MNNFVVSLAQTLSKSSEHFMKGGAGGSSPSGIPNLKTVNTFLFPVYILFFMICFLLLKSTIVFYAYNKGVPKLIESLHPNFNKNNFKEISFLTSILLLILFNTLFS